MAFLALVHRFNPEKTKVDYNAHTKDNPEHNLSVAFELAEQELGIPKLLDTKEVFEGKVDERSLVLYTSLFFHAFKAAEVSRGDLLFWSILTFAQVAQDLERQKLGTEETLATEKKKNEELMKRNEHLIAELENLKIQRDELLAKLQQQLEVCKSYFLSRDNTNIEFRKKPRKL